MRTLTIILVLLIVGLTVQTSLAQKNGDVDNLINAVTALEERPFGEETIKMRESALQWVIETDQVSVIACGGVIGAFLEKKNKFGSELTVAYTLGMAAFKLQNPGNKNENDAQLAGLESALRAYDSIVKEKPKGKFQAVEDLIVKRGNGKLAKYVEEAACGK